MFEKTESFDVVVVGGGQAGLAAGYYLAKKGLRFVILEAGARVGDSWRKRWDSLRLFTPARFDSLVGLPFPAHGDYFPTKDEMGDYLETYAKHFNLFVRLGVRVERLTREDGRYRVEAGGRVLFAEHVVVATASYQRPRLPAFSADLDAGIVQLHSSEYKSPSQLKPGGVLLVGAGNSGAEIGMDIAKDRTVYLSGREVGEVPFKMDSWYGQILGRLLLGVVFKHVVTVFTKAGQKARPGVISKGGPLIRQKVAQLEAAGIQRVPRTAGAKDGKPVLEDGRVLDVTNVIWSTGFRPNFDWIDLPDFVGEDGEPHQHAGVHSSEPGVYFLGLHFQYALSSTMIHGMSRDAAYVVGIIAERLAARAATPQLEARAAK